MEQSDIQDVIYLTENFEPVKENDPRMAMVKVRYKDGTIVFGFPEGKPVRNELFLFGGKGSGHHGHRGIPGERGGSLPGTGQGDFFIIEKREFVEEYFDTFKANAELGDDLTIDEFAEDVWSFSDKKTGLRTDIERVTITTEGLGKGQIKFSGAIKDEQGNRVGNWVRFLDPKTGTIENDLFSLDENMQGKGFGGRFYADVESKLIDYHVKQVKMFANLEVGGYAWARMGFDWEGEYHERKFSSRILNKWRERYGNTDQFPFEGDRFTPWEIATVTGPDGFALGKKILIGEGWDGVKVLDTSTRGFQVGEIYYKAKGYK